MRRRAFQLLATALVAGCVGGAQAPASKRVALVIGNSAYENAPALVNPANDAADMCAALGRLGFRTLCHTDLRDRAEFEARVAEYVAALDGASAGVVYYSGHGVQAGNANFLIPTKVQLKSLQDNPTRVLYPVDELFDRLRAATPRFQMVVLDACRTDLFGAAPGGTGRSLLLRALKNNAQAGNGLLPIKDAPPATLVLYATASKDIAFDGEGRNGPLTKHVLQHIGTRGQTVEDFIKRVTSGVERETQTLYGKRQTPYVYGSFAGTFCFAGCPGTGGAGIAF